MERQHTPLAGRLLAALALIASVAMSPSARARPAQTRAQTVHLTWIQVDTSHPDTLYVGGYLQRGYPCYVTHSDTSCAAWSARSVDGGGSWQRLVATIGRTRIDVVPDVRAYPRSFIYPASTGYVYAALAIDGSPGGSGASVWRSRDRGLHWEEMISSPGNIGSDYDNLAVSPVAAATVYAITLLNSGEGGPYDPQLRITDDAGAHWRTASGSLILFSPDRSGNVNAIAGSVVADARHRDTVYSGLIPLRVDASWPSLWARTEDAGRTWHLVANPPGSQVSPRVRGGMGLMPAGFTLGTDAHLPGLLVARVPAAPAPTRHRYVSADAGRTWRPLTCPGALHDACPIAVVDNAFGAGRSYGFYADGVHAFAGAGPAGARLPGLSDCLPTAPGSIVGAQGGARAGDPVYVLARGGDRLQLFRSIDGGRSWRRVTPRDSLVPDKGS